MRSACPRTKRLEIFADVLRAGPARATGRRRCRRLARLPALWQMGRLGRELAALDASLRQELLDLFTLSAAEYLDRWFESEPIKALFGFDGIVGNYASPYTPGSAYVLLHHVFGQCNGVKGAWGHAIGGMGAISQAIAAAAREAGAGTARGCRRARVLIEQGRAVGVELANGEILRTRGGRQRQSEAAVRTIAGTGTGTGATRERMANWRCGSGTFRMNVALSRLPEFRALPGPAITSAPASSWHPAWTTWTAPGWMRAATAGRANRSWKC
jgi:phytoene dehydrogenase-like protein